MSGSAAAITLLGLGLGCLVVRASRGTALREPAQLRDRATEAQRVAALAAARARVLAAQWSAMEDRTRS